MESFTALELNNLIREHLTPEWVEFRGRSYRVIEIRDGYAYLDRSGLKVAVSEIKEI